MERRESTELSTRLTASPAAASVMVRRDRASGFARLTTLILGMVLCAPSVLAEPSDSPEMTPPPPAAILSFLASDSVESGQINHLIEIAPIELEVNAPDEVRRPTEDPPPTPLNELLLPTDFGASSWTAATTDDVLAAAIAIGTTPELEPLNPFRKRKQDLFLKERPVSIGRADMLLRLRLRAKARKAMSVELRF